MHDDLPEFQKSPFRSARRKDCCGAWPHSGCAFRRIGLRRWSWRAAPWMREKRMMCILSVRWNVRWTGPRFPRWGLKFPKPFLFNISSPRAVREAAPRRGGTGTGGVVRRADSGAGRGKADCAGTGGSRGGARRRGGAFLGKPAPWIRRRTFSLARAAPEPFPTGSSTPARRIRAQRLVLQVFAQAGAPHEILWEAKPHIGTDRLPGAVKAIREEIRSLGGEVRFHSTVTELLRRDGVLTGVVLQDGEQIPCSQVILAVGHSARDTFRMLDRLGIHLEQKPFSLGARIEHRQSAIDRAQYGRFAGHPELGAADYRLAVHLPSGRGVYTFCMCPGGEGGGRGQRGRPRGDKRYEPPRP